MTYIQEVVSNLEMMTRLIRCLTEEDLSTIEGRKLERQFRRTRKQLVGAIVKYRYESDENG